MQPQHVLSHLRAGPHEQETVQPEGVAAQMVPLKQTGEKRTDFDSNRRQCCFVTASRLHTSKGSTISFQETIC